RLNRAVRIIVGANTRRTVDDRLKQLGRDTLNDGDLEPLTRGVYDGGARYGAADYVFALNAIHACSRAVAGFFQKFDLMLTPTLGVPPQKLGGALSMSYPDRKAFGKSVAETVGFTQFFNVTGTPAISLPLYWNSAGLPIGAQFAAAYGQEALLIRLAAQLGRARPWGQRRPVLIQSV
ncbi:MAG: amidase family protein, partial [Candidatus Hydrogenedentota bacterium]